MNALSWQLMKRMGYQPWVGLPNILLGDFVVPELLQHNATPSKLAAAALHWLDDPSACAAVSQRFEALHRELRRDTARTATDAIRAKALCCSVAEASVEEIDRLNILQATLLAMRRAIDGLRLKPIKVLIDGNQLPVVTMLAEAIVDGDAKVKSISAASILAKVHRDRLCLQLDALHP